MINKCLNCILSCSDVNRDRIFPKVDLKPARIRLIMISEAPPIDRTQYFYESPSGSFFRTTQMAFADAGIPILSYVDLTRMGVYLTTAIKCSKKGYAVCSSTIKGCSLLLEAEITQFPNIKVVMCMGDVAIKAINSIGKRSNGVNVIPTGSTYRIRDRTYEQGGIRYFPSYTQTGDSFDIEKVKRRMVSEDIKQAMAIGM